MKLLYLLLTASFLITACGNNADAENNTASLALSKWEKLGIGDIQITDNDDFTLSVPTLEDSKGLMFVSEQILPDSYRLSFDFQTNNDQGVLVLLLAFDKVNDTGVVVNDDYDGNWAYFRDGDMHQAYAIALHTHAHQPNTFIRKIPGFTLLAQTHDPFETRGASQWNTFIVEKRGGNLKLILDDEQLLIETNDFMDEPLGKGHLAFRLSPAEKEPFVVHYRNLQITPLTQ